MTTVLDVLKVDIEEFNKTYIIEHDIKSVSKLTAPDFNRATLRTFSIGVFFLTYRKTFHYLNKLYSIHYYS